MPPTQYGYNILHIGTQEQYHYIQHVLLEVVMAVIEIQFEVIHYTILIIETFVCHVVHSMNTKKITKKKHSSITLKRMVQFQPNFVYT